MSGLSETDSDSESSILQILMIQAISLRRMATHPNEVTIQLTMRTPPINGNRATVLEKDNQNHSAANLTQYTTVASNFALSMLLCCSSLKKYSKLYGNKQISVDGKTK